MVLCVIRCGRWHLYAICNARGDCELLEFLTPGSSGDKLAGDKRRMLAFLDRVAHSPERPRNVEVSHLVDRESGIWQFTKGRVRVLWFYDEGMRMVFSHGFHKETQKTPRGELEKARRAVAAYFRAKKAGTFHFLEDQ